MTRRIGYLSGAPRVSTAPEAELSGPRNHVLGVIWAFEQLGWDVRRFIVGDRVPRSWVVKGSERTMTRSWLRTLVADGIRLLMGIVNAHLAWQELGDEVDWVYERFAVLHTLGWIFKRRGKLWILETNGPGFYEASDRKTLVLTNLAKRLELQAYSRCDYLVCITDTLKEIILHEVNIPPDKIVVMPNGVDTALFDPAQHRPRRIHEGFTIGYVGSLIPRQGIALLLEAVHDLKHDGIEINLTVVGDGRMREPWEAQSIGLGLSEQVCFVGPVPRHEVPAYILGFDVGFSGQSELSIGKMFYSPQKQYEYMAMAVPVIASIYEDTQRVIDDGETGFLFKPGDKDGLKQTIKKARQNKSRLAEMGRRARQEIVAHHSWVSRVSDMLAYIASTQQ